MNRIVFAVALSAWAAHATAASTCTAQATEKKVTGAALNSFMKKCEADAKATCEATAKEEKLAGATKDSFVKQCVGNAVGSK